MHQTPMRVAAASVPAGNVSAKFFKRETTYAVLNTELDDGVVDNVYEMQDWLFPKRCFPELFTLDKAYAAVSAGRNPVFGGSRWTRPPVLVADGPDRSQNEQRVCRFLDDIAAVISKELGIPVIRKWHANWATRPLATTDSASTEACQRQPDSALLPINLPVSRARRRHAASYIQVKAKNDGSGKTKASVQLGEETRLTFGAQHNRRFVMGITWIGEWIKLYCYDRSGVFSSKALHLHDDWKQVLRIVCGFAFGDDASIGYDPAFYMEGGKEMVKIYTKESEMHFEVLKVLHNASVIRGRGTVVLRVRDPKTGEHYALKSSWVDRARPEKEWDLLKDAEAVIGIAHIYTHELVARRPWPGDADTTHAIRRFIVAQAKKAQRDGYTKKQLAEMEQAAAQANAVECREHRRILLKECGLPLTEFRSLSEFISVIISAVKAHKEMLDKKKVLHRDISLRNILIRDETTDGYRAGLLIDFDYGVTYPRLSENTDTVNEPSPKTNRDAGEKKVAKRSGTLPFMSTRLLLEELVETAEHSPRDDLESVLYVIIWICIVQAGPCGAERRGFNIDNSRLLRWISNSYKQAGEDKFNDMTHPRQWKLLIDQFHAYFKPLTGMLVQLRDLFFKNYDTRTDLTTDEIYKRFIDILEAALKDIEPTEPPLPPAKKWEPPAKPSELPVRRSKRGREGESSTSEPGTAGSLSTVMPTLDPLFHDVPNKKMRMDSAPADIPSRRGR